MIPHRTALRIFEGHVQTKFVRHCDAYCPYEFCSELAADLWERMTFGGAVARYCEIVPNNIYLELAGQKVSYPYGLR